MPLTNPGSPTSATDALGLNIRSVQGRRMKSLTRHALLTPCGNLQLEDPSRLSLWLIGELAYPHHHHQQDNYLEIDLSNTGRPSTVFSLVFRSVFYSLQSYGEV